METKSSSSAATYGPGSNRSSDASPSSAAVAAVDSSGSSSVSSIGSSPGWFMVLRSLHFLRSEPSVGFRAAYSS